MDPYLQQRKKTKINNIVTKDEKKINNRLKYFEMGYSNMLLKQDVSDVLGKLNFFHNSSQIYT